ncbi:MAG: SPFH domain-containing protein [Dehalococcoidia bacterium]
MAILDVIEWVDPSGQEIVHRVPEVGSAEFRLGSQLIVRETQSAIFFRDGKALDAFSPGRHTLSTNNIPILANILSIPFGGKSPFRAEVYFVILREFVDQKWGTPEPIPYRDAELGMVRLRAFGSFAMAVNNPMLFVNKIVGGQGLFSTPQVSNYLRAIIVSSLTDLLGENMKSIFDLPGLYDEIAAGTRARVQDAFAALGLELRALNVQAITPPEEVQRAIDQRSGMGAIGLQNMDAYMRFQAAQAMRDAAQNQGAAGAGAAEGLGIGAGLGMGAAMAGMVSQAMRPAEPATPVQPAATPSAMMACPNCRAQIPVNSKFCPECGNKLGGPTRCPQCNTEVPAGGKFCPECGARVTQ